MTQAVPDKIDFMGDVFILCPVFSYKKGGQILTSEDIGLEKKAYSTSCWSGFTSHYSIDEDKQLSLNSLSLIGATSICKNICGREVVIENTLNKIRGIDYFPFFTGALLLLKDYFKKSNCIYNCPEDYETVIELELVKGKVIQLTAIRVKGTSKNGEI